MNESIEMLQANHMIMPLKKAYRLVFVLLISLLASITPVRAELLQGRVVRIADGDTVTVLDAANTQHKVRLTGIDAPEKAQAFGSKSKSSLSSLVFEKQVSIEYSKQDRYGRTLGKITVDGIDANLEQIKLGMAWHYKHYQREQSAEDQALYADAEDQARSERRGLWLDDNPVPPLEWRKEHRRKSN